MACLGVSWLDNLLDQLWSDKLCKGLVDHFWKPPLCQLLPFYFGKVSNLINCLIFYLLQNLEEFNAAPPAVSLVLRACLPWSVTLGSPLSKMQLFPLEIFRPIFLERSPYFMGLIALEQWIWLMMSILHSSACEIEIINILAIREGIKKNRFFFLGKSPKLWVGGGQES